MMNGKYKNGYIKVCASWTKRMWNSELKKPTEMFDNCGVYDNKTAIAKPSQYPKWTEALSFLEWYGVPLMNHFGIIIIDDEN